MNTTSPPPRWRLATGQTAHLPVDAGSRLMVLAGRVRVEWPVEWMGEVALRQTMDAGVGLTGRFERAGWVAVRALADTEICLQPRETPAAQPRWRLRKAQA